MDYSLQRLPPPLPVDGEIVREAAPRAAGAQHVEDHVELFALAVRRARPRALAMIWYGKRTIRAYAVPDRSDRYRRRPSEFGLPDVRW